MDIHKNVHPSAVPQITVSEVTLQGSFSPGPSEKLHRKSPPCRNLKNKARVFCPFLKRKGHCLKGSRCDFSHKFIPLDERGSKFQHNSFKRFPPVNTYLNRNLPPFPFNPNSPPPPSFLTSNIPTSVPTIPSPVLVPTTIYEYTNKNPCLL